MLPATVAVEQKPQPERRMMPLDCKSAGLTLPMKRKSPLGVAPETPGRFSPDADRHAHLMMDSPSPDDGQSVTAEAIVSTRA